MPLSRLFPCVDRQALGSPAREVGWILFILMSPGPTQH